MIAKHAGSEVRDVSGLKDRRVLQKVEGTGEEIIKRIARVGLCGKGRKEKKKRKEEGRKKRNCRGEDTEKDRQEEED